MNSGSSTCKFYPLLSLLWLLNSVQSTLIYLYETNEMKTWNYLLASLSVLIDCHPICESLYILKAFSRHSKLAVTFVRVDKRRFVDLDDLAMVHHRRKDECITCPGEIVKLKRKNGRIKHKNSQIQRSKLTNSLIINMQSSR